MNCTEFAEWTGLYLSGEIDVLRRAAFEAHGGQCAACLRTLEASRSIDQWMRQVADAEVVDPANVLRATRRVIGRELAYRRWLPVAALALLSVAGAAYWNNSSLPAGLFASVAKDHHAEVVNRTPRRWRASGSDVRPLLDAYGVRAKDVDALLPAGFILEKAKQCGIDGKPTLHLVFSDGKRQMSVYVETPGIQLEMAATVLDDTEIASFRRGNISGVVVSTSPGLCAEAVRRLSAL